MRSWQRSWAPTPGFRQASSGPHDRRTRTGHLRTNLECPVRGPPVACDSPKTRPRGLRSAGSVRPSSSVPSSGPANCRSSRGALRRHIRTGSDVTRLCVLCAPFPHRFREAVEVVKAHAEGHRSFELTARQVFKISCVQGSPRLPPSWPSSLLKRAPHGTHDCPLKAGASQLMRCATHCAP